jgi:hypothetical protein
MAEKRASLWARVFGLDSAADLECSSYPKEMGDIAREAKARLESRGVFDIELEAQREIRSRVREPRKAA